jgi:hypothetical protein
MRVESKRLSVLADESNVAHHSAASLFLLAGAEKQGRAFGTPLLRASILWAGAPIRSSTFSSTGTARLACRTRGEDALLQPDLSRPAGRKEKRGRRIHSFSDASDAWCVTASFY